jgi:hypothetical protein
MPIIEGGEDLRDESYSNPYHDEFGRQFDPFTRDYYIGDFPPDYEGMNIYNPQPGKRYYYCTNPERDGGSNLLHLANKYGAELVGPDDPEYIGLSRAGFTRAHSGNAYRAFGDVVLCRMSQDRYDEVEERERAERRDALADLVAKYKDEDPHPNGKPIRYVLSEHGQTIEER